MSEIKSVQCANFTATLGETFRFSLVRESGNVGGMIQTGQVQRIHRAAPIAISRRKFIIVEGRERILYASDL